MSPQGPPHPGFPRDWEVGRGLGVGLEPRAESEPHLTPWRRAVVVAAAGLLGRGHGGHGWRSAQLALLGGRWSSRGDGKGVNELGQWFPAAGGQHTYPVRAKVKSLSRVRLFATPRTVAYKAPPSMGFSRQEYWSGLPFPPPGDLSHPGIEPGSPAL